MTFLAESIVGAAQRFGARAALVEPDGAVVTYADLDRRSNAVARALRREGVRAGSVHALTMPSNVEYVVNYLALAKIGAVAAGLNPRQAAPERAAVLERLHPGLVVEHDPPAVIVFTSGTSGAPKGAVFGDRQLEAICRFDIGGVDVWDGGGPMLASTQFCHIGFMTKLPWYLRTGSTLLLQERWRADRALRLIAEHRVRSVGGVAAQIALLLRVPDFDTHDVSSVETIIVGGGPSPAALVSEACRRFGARYSIRYSSTESGGVGTATAFDAPEAEALHTVGRPRPGIGLRIDPDSGEVLLRSPAMMSGYWRDEARTDAALRDGWLHTGDVGEIDAEGCLRLRGRTTDMYIRGGYNVHPQAVEAVLLEHPNVAQVAVVPRPDDVMGEIGVACVVPSDAAHPPTLDDLRAFAAERLASYELPEALAVVDSIPLTTMDKVDRGALVGRASGAEQP